MNVKTKKQFMSRSNKFDESNFPFGHQLESAEDMTEEEHEGKYYQPEKDDKQTLWHEINQISDN